MGLFDKFKKKNSETTAPVEQQAPASTQQVGTGVSQTPNAGINQQPITQETGLNAIAPETGMLADNPFVEAPSVDLVEDKIVAPTAPNFDNIFNAQPSDLIATPEPTLDTNNVVPNLYDTGARIDTPNPIVEQQIALDVHPDEVFEGGNTKEDEITRIVANSVNQNAQPQDFASPSVNVNPIEAVAQPEPIQPAPVAEPTPQVVEPTPQPQDFASPSINVNTVEPVVQPEPIQPAPVAEPTPQVVELTPQSQDFVSPSVNVNPIEPVVQPATVQPTEVAEQVPQVVELSPEPQIVEATQKPQEFVSPSINANPIESTVQPEVIPPTEVAQPTALSESTIEETIPNIPFGVTAPSNPEPINAENQNIAKDTFTSTPELISPSINVNPIEPAAQPEIIQPAGVAQPVPQIVDLTPQPQTHESLNINTNDVVEPTIPDSINSDQPMPADNVEESLTQQDNLQNLNESTQGTENAIQQEQILRDENTKTKFCDYCGTMVNQYTAICPNCGEAIK